MKRVAMALVVGTVVHLGVAWAPYVDRWLFPPSPPTMCQFEYGFDRLPEVSRWSPDRVWLDLGWDLDFNVMVRGAAFVNNHTSSPGSAVYVTGPPPWQWDRGTTVHVDRCGWPWLSLQAGWSTGPNSSFGYARLWGVTVPSHPRPAQFIGNTVVFGGPVYALLLLVGVARRRSDVCRTCGHRLLARQAVCPECGSAVRRPVRDRYD